MADNPTSTTPELRQLDPTPSIIPATTTAGETTPPKPQRPVSPEAQAKETLKEAFPTVDDSVIEAVLIASGGNVEPAFNALLGMTDPSYKPEITSSVPHPGDSYDQPFSYATSTPRSQLEQDEQLARRLAGEGRSRRQDRRSSRDRQQGPYQQSQGQQKEHSFIDDDLPVIRDNIKKGWSTLMSKVKSKLDGEPEQPPMPPPRPGEYSYHQQTSRYDSDPRVLGDDFSHLNLQDSTNAPRRPLANPDLFKSTRFSNTASDSAPPLKPPRPETNSASSPPTQTQTQMTPSKKWEPLRPAEDRDPFALGDSDDEDGKDDLYGTALPKVTSVPVGTQETGVIETPLDPAIETTKPKPL